MVMRFGRVPMPPQERSTQEGDVAKNRLLCHVQTQHPSFTSSESRVWANSTGEQEMGCKLYVADVTQLCQQRFESDA